jgi:HAD superfamily hydrolase (TIGR01549 family)
MEIIEKVMIFDLNDTLINTIYTAFKRNEYCFARMEIKGPTLKEFETVFGGDFPQCIGKWLPHDRVEEFYDIYPASRQTIRYQAFCDLTALFNKMKKEGKKLVILTNTSVEQFEKKADDIQLDIQMIDLILCNAMKPDINSLTKVQEYFGVNKKDMLFIGDDLLDFQMARTFDINYLAVLTGLVDRQMFLQQGISNQLIIESVNELL